MRKAARWGWFVPLVVASLGACGGDDPPAVEPVVDGGGSSGTSGESSSSSGSSSDCANDYVYPADSSPVLAAAEYATLLTIAESFPFDVVGHYTTTVFADELDSQALGWGAHGGPFVALAQGGGDWEMHQLTAPATPTGVLTDTIVRLEDPVEHEEFLSGPHSLPDGRFLFAYTDDEVSGPGSAYLYTGSTQSSFAAIDGLGTVQGFKKGALSRYLYTARSPFVEGLDAPGNPTLYVQNACPSGALVDPACAPSALLELGAERNTVTNRIAVDANGNVALALDGLSAGIGTDVLAVSHCASTGTSTVPTTVLHSYPHSATVSLAFLPPTEALSGYLVEVGLDGDLTELPPIATPVRAEGPGFVVAGADIPAALHLPTGSSGELHVLGGHDGYLWVHVIVSGGDHVLKLRRRVTTP